MKTRITKSPSEVAKDFCAAFDLGSIVYAGDPERLGERGFASLVELAAGADADTNEMLATAAEIELDGTAETLAQLNDCIDAITQHCAAEWGVCKRALDAFYGRS